MKIAYVLYPAGIISGKSNGIRSQANAWACILREKGHTVDEINTWGNYRWTDYHIIHFFGSGLWLNDILPRISKLNQNLVFSPIVDPDENCVFDVFKSNLNFKHLKIRSKESIIKETYKYFKYVFVRSKFEQRFIERVYNINPKNVLNVPVSYSHNIDSDLPTKEKENFCLHVSSITHERKNVIRLIQAAVKYNFRLILAGSKGSKTDYEPIHNAIGDNKNIEVLGFVSDDQLLDLYKKAKVFALPSLNEGVGIVALDAAVYGCEIAITNIGGPKEYYNGYAKLINPYSVDEIGTAIIDILKKDHSYQPKLREYVIANYSRHSVGNELEEKYKMINSYSV